MSKIVGRHFHGIGADANELPWKPELNGQYLDEVLGFLPGPFDVVEGNGHCYFGIQAAFVWDCGEDYPKTREQCVQMIAKALQKVFRDDASECLSLDKFLPYIGYIEDEWTELW